jgi:hypothetical protein
MSALHTETWRPIPGHEGYSVSSHGNVRSEPRTLTRSDGRPYRVAGRILSAPVRHRDGYREVNLCALGSNRVRCVHQLVLLAFVGPRPDGMQGCHGDGNKLNNHVENLRWDTPAANSADSIAHGVTPRGESAPNARLTEAQALAIRADGRVHTRIAADYGITSSHVSSIKSRRTWAHI